MQDSADSRVTVVVAAYNHSSYVRSCLESVAAQVGVPFELIVTDDASCDDSQQVIVEEIERLDLNAQTVFHSVNVGICATFNEALSLVRTPYVAFLSADDWMAPERLSRQVALLDAASEGTALVYSDMWLASSDGTLTGSRHRDGLPAECSCLQEESLFSQLLRTNCISTPTVLSKVQCLRDVGGYDEELAFEDYDMWLRLAKVYNFELINEPLVYYRITPGSLGDSLRKDPRASLSMARLLVKHLGGTSGDDDYIAWNAFRNAVDAYRGGIAGSEVLRYFWVYWVRSRSLAAAGFTLLALSRWPGHLLPRFRSQRISA